MQTIGMMESTDHKSTGYSSYDRDVRLSLVFDILYAMFPARSTAVQKSL